MNYLYHSSGRLVSRHSTQIVALTTALQSLFIQSGSCACEIRDCEGALQIVSKNEVQYTIKVHDGPLRPPRERAFVSVLQFKGPTPSIGWYNCVNDVYRKLSNLPDLSKMRHLDLAYLYVDASDNCVGVQHLAKGDLKGPGKATLEDMAKLNAARLMKPPAGAWAVLLLLKTVDNCFSNYKKKL